MTPTVPLYVHGATVRATSGEQFPTLNPASGATLALDFPDKGESTRRLLAQMADAVLAAGGRLYPAKDATMSAAVFRAGYPDWRKVESLRDPALMSDFWRRVTAGAQ